MSSLVRIQKYHLAVGHDSYILTVEEKILGPVHGANRFKLQLPAARGRAARTFYGETELEVAMQAAEFMQAWHRNRRS